MNDDLFRARRLLDAGSFTCVLCRAQNTQTTTERGVKPLLAFLESGDSFRNFSAADRVVGKAAAHLYALLGIRALYAGVLSRPAKETLERFGITVEYTTLVDAIQNRTKDGFCPMEQAVWAIDEPQEALRAIQEKLRSLSQANS